MRDAQGRLTLTGALAIAGAVLFLLCAAGGLWVWKIRGTGATCRVDSDCTSRACLLIGFGFRGGVCTEMCRDDDCPSDMRCGEAERSAPATPFGETGRQVCVPTAERIRELR